MRKHCPACGYGWHGPYTACEPAREARYLARQLHALAARLCTAPNLTPQAADLMVRLDAVAYELERNSRTRRTT